MIPREMLKRDQQIEIRTTRIGTVSGSARLRRAVFGVAPKTASHRLFLRGDFEIQSHEGSGATPEPARATRTLPNAVGARASARFTARPPSSSKTNPTLNSI